MAWIPKYPENIPGGDSIASAVLSRHTTRHDRGETQPVRLSGDVIIVYGYCATIAHKMEVKVKTK